MNWSEVRQSKLTLAAILCAVIQAVGCGNRPVTQKPGNTADGISEQIQGQINTFCSDCHAMPDPASFPKDAWHGEVQRGYGFYYASGRTDLELPVVSDTVRYFVERAPTAMALQPPEPIDRKWLDRFEQIPLAVPQMKRAAVSFIDYVDLQGSLGRGLLFSDMHGGAILFSKVEQGKLAEPIQIASVSNPAVVRTCDWNRDGLLDLMVADLGSYLPEDHDRGRVVWLERKGVDAQFEPSTMVDGVGRVASVEIGDLDQDGQQDILVAEFGWQTTGSIFYLSRQTDGDHQTLVKKSVDLRQGAIHVPMVDINQDGYLDFIALFSQQYESIQAFINDGKGQFQAKPIYVASDPSFGSSGIELTDVNKDNRLDILYTNGDSFDSFVLKPTHSVQWLENKGDLNFEAHLVGKMPGAHRALMGDFDGDSRKEIIASAFIPESLVKAQVSRKAEGLVVWQPSGANFSKHVLITSAFGYAAMCVADLDSNGKDDIIVGDFSMSISTPAILVMMSQ